MSILKKVVSREAFFGCIFFLFAGTASAELLGVSPGQPNVLIFPSGNLPNVSYDAGTDTLAVEGRPVLVRFSDGTRVVVSNGILTINASVDSAGVTSGGTLLVTGTANNGASYGSPLLEGTLLEYGSSDSAFLNGDKFDFRFDLTGGSLAPLYGDDDIGVALNLEGSDYSGSFATSWMASKVKGNVGPIPPLECTGTIGDFVWRDNNRDGIQDLPEEPGIENVLVELLDSTGAIIATDRTDASGEYEFTGLCAGDYTVRISSTDPDTDAALDGLDPTQLGQGTPATDSDDPAGTSVNLPTDDSNNDTIDFGYKPPVLGMIGDFVWEDTNGNGIQGAGEDGIQGITVNLYDCNNVLFDSTSTLADGSYKFNNVAAGSYIVEFDATNTDYQFSPANQGNDDTVDSDASTAAATQIKRTGCFSFDPTEWPDGFDDTRDAGLYLPVSLGDFVWDDLNEDGQQDSDEPGVNGVTATLSRFNDCNDPNQGTTLVGSTVTATGTPLNNPGATPADGYYSFTDLQPGCYKVTFSFNQQDYPAYIFTAADQGSDLTDSDADPANGMTGLITLDSGDSDPTIDAGIYQPDTAQLGNFIWLDLNADGIQDPNEEGIEGAKAQLYSCDANGIPDEPVAGVAEQTTAADGSYLFDNLSTGSYAVKFTVPADIENPYMFSPDNQGTDDKIDSDANAVNPGDTMAFSHCVTLDVADENLRVNLTVDAGVFQKASIGDFVWFDEDRDGIQDPGESGLGLDDGGNPIGVIVNLYTCTGTTRDPNVFASTTADATTGFYEFTGLVPDDYAVEFVSPDGFVFSPQNQGGDDAADSDADSSGSAACTNLVSGENDPTWDAGLNKPAQAALEIIKKTNDTDNNEPTGPFITVSDTVIWTYIVTNTGTEDLSNVVLTDDSGTPADPNDDVTVSCYSDSDFTTLSTELPMDSTLYCQLVNDDPGAIAGQYGNIGEVCGEYQEYNDELMQFETKTICASDPDHYFGATPSIDIRKQNDDSTGEPGDLDDVRTVVAGSDVTFTITVTNNGELPLDSIAISDFIDPDTLGLDDSDCLRMFNEIPPSSLQPDGFHTFTCTIPNVTADFTNTACADAKVAGEDAEAPYLVDDCDTSRIIVVTPAIDIEKATNGQDADSAPGVQLAVGDTATFTYVVVTNGNEPIGNVTVTDDQGLIPVFQGGDSDNDGLLDPGETWTYKASTTVTAGQYTNIGTVNGIGDDTGTPVSDADPSNHFGTTAPAISLVKVTSDGVQADGDNLTIAQGTPITWKYTVTNIGDVALENLNLVDNQEGTISCSQTTLAVGESTTCMQAGIAEAGAYANTAEVCATDATGVTPDAVCASDPSNYFGTTAPAISLVKVTSDGVQADGDNLTIAQGTPITWKYTVTNIGDVALENLNLVDNQEGTISCSQTTLAVGESTTCMQAGIAEAGAYANTAEVCATDATGVTPDAVCASDPSNYFGTTAPAISLVKVTSDGVQADGDNLTIAQGTPITWKYTVTNIGDVALENLNLVDNQEGTISCSQTTLAVGESTTCMQAGIAEAGAYANTAEVCATDATGVTPDAVCASDPSNYFGTTAPAISLVKVTTDGATEGDGLTIAEGTAIAWKYTVTNNGDVALENLLLIDDQEGTISCPQSTLAVGEAIECYRMGTAGLGLYENSAEVCGVDATGATEGPVCDDDPSSYTGVPVCNLALDKMCFVVPPPPSSEFFCDKPIDSLTMIWTESYTVWVEAWKGEVGSESLGVKSVGPGEEITFTGYAGSPNDVFWEIYTDAGLTSKIGESKFHLSCSDGDMDGETDNVVFPNDCGKPQGDGKDNDSTLLNLWQLEGMVDAINTLDCTVDDTPTYAQACEFTLEPAPSCETTGNPDFLTWRYEGGTCGESTFGALQSDFECLGEVNPSEAITVVDDKGVVYEDVNPGDEITMERDGAKMITLTDASGSTQTIILHTSCSQPIVAGETAGALRLVALDDLRAEQEVEYAYMVTNNSSGTVTGITISDDKLTVEDSILSLAPGASDSVTASAFLDYSLFTETDGFTNTATASGSLGGQVCASPADSVTVFGTIPPCDIGILVYDISDDALKLKLTNTDSRNRIATLEEIMITYPELRSAIREVKLDGAIYKRDDSDTTFMSPATIGEDDWTEDDVTKRELDPGETRTLEIKTFRKTDKEDAQFTVTLKFKEGCEYTFEIDYSDKGTTVQFP